MSDTDNFINMRVAAKSNVKNLATSIAKNIQEGKRVELDAIGAGAVNQAAKACAVAAGQLAPLGYDVLVKPAFKTIEFEEAPGEAKEGEESSSGSTAKSALCFILVTKR